MLVDGIDTKKSEDLHFDHAELRITGPYMNELSKDDWRLLVDVNILVTEQMAQTSRYKLQTWCGKLALSMNGPISIYKYGGEAGDDSSYVGCLRPVHGKIDPNRVLYFGQLGKVEKIRQGMIDGHFVVYL
jgi:hypothetical protein